MILYNQLKERRDYIMNKMSFKKLKELFLKKYPNGAIFQDSNYVTCMAVVFNKNQRVYHYSYNNYLDLAKRLKLIDDNVLYKRSIKSLQKMIEREEKRLEDVINDRDTFYLFTKEEEIESIKKEIRDMQVLLETSVELA
jgi:hypothetical protein